MSVKYLYYCSGFEFGVTAIERKVSNAKCRIAPEENAARFAV